VWKRGQPDQTGAGPSPGSRPIRAGAKHDPRFRTLGLAGPDPATGARGGRYLETQACRARRYRRSASVARSNSAGSRKITAWPSVTRTMSPGSPAGASCPSGFWRSRVTCKESLIVADGNGPLRPGRHGDVRRLRASRRPTARRRRGDGGQGWPVAVKVGLFQAVGRSPLARRADVRHRRRRGADEAAPVEQARPTRRAPRRDRAPSRAASAR
jgi:hypothetical protein